MDTGGDIQVLPWTLPENAALLREMNRQLSVAGDLEGARKVRETMIGTGYGTPPPGSDLVLLCAALDGAFARFLVAFERYGGHRFHGWTDYGDAQNYLGPMFWTEGDCVFRLAIELEREFPEQVHLELPVARENFADFDANTDKRQFIDLVVSDMRSFESDGPAESAEERFRTRRHKIFVEAKYFPSGCSGPWKFDHVRKVEDVVADANRLARHLERGHSAVAAVLVIDDDNLFEDHRGEYDWPQTVEVLVASPRELAARAASSSG